ncbi:MAG: CxxxxCH/CxxCH domain-containing protein, partial [Deltaproteobacteria bacterium]|nr:CxxxxCH/CxxCH domain-containing protein [Deltaproteobacteria bacterium]
PPSHAQAACETCHREARHLDGVLDVPTGCDGCHRSAPVFADLAGSTLPSAITVGAHQAHLTGAARLRGPIACGECHRVPASVTAAGHLDSPLPAEVEFGPLARADGAVPRWDRAAATCSGTYCHGGGIWLASDPVAGTVRTPSWTEAVGQVFCGSCHGVPPTTHGPMTLAQCAGCHPSVDAAGAPIVTGSTSRHMDGVVDVDHD